MIATVHLPGSHRLVLDGETVLDTPTEIDLVRGAAHLGICFADLGYRQPVGTSKASMVTWLEEDSAGTALPPGPPWPGTAREP